MYVYIYILKKKQEALPYQNQEAPQGLKESQEASRCPAAVPTIGSVSRDSGFACL